MPVVIIEQLLIVLQWHVQQLLMLAQTQSARMLLHELQRLHSTHHTMTATVCTVQTGVGVATHIISTRASDQGWFKPATTHTMSTSKRTDELAHAVKDTVKEEEKGLTRYIKEHSVASYMWALAPAGVYYY
jgi:hypothetical protein